MYFLNAPRIAGKNYNDCCCFLGQEFFVKNISKVFLKNLIALLGSIYKNKKYFNCLHAHSLNDCKIF